MSGGSLDYFYCQLEDHVGDFKDLELDNLVKDLAALFHDREWYLSGDTSEGNWNEAIDKFKKRWFTDHGRQERIEQYLAEFAQEIRRSFGMGEYCRDCKHWTLGKNESKYGRCEFIKGCMIHECDSVCNKYEKRQEVTQ